MGAKFRMNGKTYDVPEQDLDTFLNMADERGVKPEPIDEPEDAPDPSAGGRVPPEQQQPSDPSPRVVDNPQASVRAGIPEQGPPPAQNQQVEPQSKDWITGAITALANGYRSIGGQFASDGADYQPSQQDAQAYSQRFQNAVDRPGATAAAVATDVASPVMSAAVPGSAAGRIAMGAVNQAVPAGVENYATAPDEGRAIKALKAAAVAGGAGAALGTAGEAVSGVAGGLYNRMRMKAGDIDPDELKAFMGKRGIRDANEGAARMVSEFEQQVPPNLVVPRSPNTIANQADAAGSRLSAGADDALARAQAAGAVLPRNPRAQVAQGLYNQADDALASGANPEMGPPLSRVAQDVQAGPQQFTPQDVRAQKMAFDKVAYGGEPGTPESFMGQAKKSAADQYRGMLGDYTQQAGPEIAGQYNAANRGYEAVAPFQRGAGDQALNEAVGRGISSDGAGFWGKAGNFAGQMTGMQYAPDLAANAARPVAGLGDAASWVSRAAGTAADGQDIAQSLLSRGQRQAPMQTSGGSQSMDNSRGDLLGDNVWALMNGPDKLALQPFAAELAKGLDPDGADDRSRFNANVERLMRTNGDFKKRVMPLLGGQ